MTKLKILDLCLIVLCLATTIITAVLILEVNYENIIASFTVLAK